MTRLALLFTAAAALLLLFASVYTVSETEQVILTQFGRPVGGVLKEPGLHLKVPFVQTLHRFDSGSGVTAGVTYSPDAKTLYVAKPLTRQLQAWDLSGDRRFLSRIGFSEISPYGSGFV